MLTVYSTQGSPGASTTAMHLAAHWASAGREILLIEADPAGGSLSHNLGIQFTPGSASFVASGLPILSNHLIDHAQDVLFENLHVMPAPASPTGARGIFNTFADFSEDLRTISENEMAVIIDGGRVTADTAASGLTTSAAGVMVVCRNNNQLPSLEHLRDALAASPGGDGPQGCSVTVGKSPMDPEEWQENCGLTFCGSIEIVADMATDLSAYLARSKRKSKKWRASLEQVGEKLYPYAQPPVSNRPRRPATAAPPDTEVSSDAGQATPAAAPPDTEVSSDAGQATPAAAPPDTEVSSDAGQGTPAAAPPDTEVSSDAGQATPAAATFDPAAHDPAGYGQAPPEGFPAYGQAPPMAPAPQPGQGQSHYLPPTPESPPGQGQSHYLPPTGWAADPQNPGGSGYGEAPPEGFPAYGQPTQPLYQPPQYPSQPYEQPPQYPSQPYEQPPQYPSQPYEQPPQYPSQPRTYEQPPQYPSQPYEQPPQYPSQPYEQPAAYQQQPGTYQQPPQYPSQPGTYEQPPPGAHEQPPNYEADEPPQYPSHSYEQPAAQPEPPAQEAAHPQPPETESPPRPNMKPTGSFRDWAVKLHGSNAEDMTAHRGG